MDTQISVSFDPESGYIIVELGQMKIGLTPRDTLGLAAILTQIVGQLPQLQPRGGPQILVAGALPKLAGGIDFND